MLVFRNPEWFALLPVLALAGWYWRRLELWRPLRIAVLLLLTIILARPQMKLIQDGVDLYVLLDRSASTEAKIDQGLPEWKSLLESARRSRNDHLVWVDYALDVIPQEKLGSQPFSGSRNLTRTAQAIQHTLAMRDQQRPARVLVFTDGYSTEPLAGVTEKLLREGVPLDVRFLTDLQGDDFRISRMKLPARAQVAEPFLIDLAVIGPKDGKFPLSIHRDGQELITTEIEVKQGRGVARFSDRIAVSGAHRYEAFISPPDDKHPGNNHFENWVEITGGPRLLVVSGYENDPCQTILRTLGFDVEVVTAPSQLQVGQLAGCRAVLFNNVPAHSVPSDFLASLDFFVTQQGGGLLMTGGNQSFGSGGYSHSPVDPLLPVSMELKMDQRKLSVAMAIVMDRSGSMGASVAGGHIKMDLANDGAAKAIEMLGLQDSIAVFAVDSTPHEAFGMQQIRTQANKESLMEACRRIQVGGGGIYTFTGLKAGWNALKSTSYGTRHLILFADAADAEEPGGYVALMDEMVKEGATVSVIALGTKSDPDAAFLQDVADRGKGRIFFASDAAELPNIFTQETVAVARSAFIKDPVATSATGGWFEVSGKDFTWLPEVDGFNLSYRKDWASQALVTQDEYAAPLVAWGQRGAGRTAAVSFPLGGEHSQRVRNWPKLADFLQTLGRWLMGEELPAGLGLKYDLSGTTLTLELLYDPEWEEKFAANAPKIVLAEGARAEAQRELTWRRLAPGHYSAAADLSEGQMVRGVIQADKHVLAFGPVIVGSQAEWAFDPIRIEELRQTSLTSGGRELVDLKDAWQSPAVRRFADLRHWLLLAALGLALAEALVTRMGWRLPEFPSLRGVKILTRRAKAPAMQPARVEPAYSAKQPVSAAASSPPPAQTQPASAEPDLAEQRRSRFAKAKKHH
jgi:uncharacterized membrane protein